MKDYDDIPSPEIIAGLLAKIRPGSALEAILPLEASYSNYTHLIEAVDPVGQEYRLIVRRYAVFGNYDRGEKARREFAVLKYASQNGIPVPDPLYLDQTGEMLGIPGIVIGYVDGAVELNPQNPDDYAGKLAETLVKIHSRPCDIPDGNFILDGNAEASWFLRQQEVRDVIAAYPMGKEVLAAAERLYPDLEKTPPALVHTDYYPGNVMLKDGVIAAVVDWEEAGIGDPIIDVAYCQMELSLSGFFSAADTLLNTYESLTGKKAANLLFWQLAACARPMNSPPTWSIDEPQRKDNFARFVKSVLRKMIA